LSRCGNPRATLRVWSASVAAGLDLDLPAPDLTALICDIPSVSGDEKLLADAVDEALRRYPHLRVDRNEDTVVARTQLGRDERVVIAGHLDTVPISDNLPTHREDDFLWGRGTVDMKGGVAVALRLATHLDQPTRDVTYVFYDHEEVEAARSGLARVIRDNREWLFGDFAVLMEPTSAQVEGGCNGTMRAEIVARGRAAHSARPWMGSNAVHAAADILDRLRLYRPAELEVDGLVYREGLNAVEIRGGIAGNVIPDRCVVTVNYRFAPSRGEQEAENLVRDLFSGYEVTVIDSAPGALPGCTIPLRRRSSRRLALSRGRSTDGPTYPASRHWACPPSTMARATRTWLTPTTSGSRSPRSSTAKCACGPG
jgi:succinyl-diaminopimelate desuccinylase